MKFLVILNWILLVGQKKFQWHERQSAQRFNEDFDKFLIKKLSAKKTNKQKSRGKTFDIARICSLKASFGISSRSSFFNNSKQESSKHVERSLETRSLARSRLLYDFLI